jgi:hypothetical protein
VACIAQPELPIGQVVSHDADGAAFTQLPVQAAIALAGSAMSNSIPMRIINFFTFSSPLFVPGYPRIQVIYHRLINDFSQISLRVE